MAIEINTPQEFIAMKDWTDRGSADALIDVVITQDLDFSGIENFEGVGTEINYINIDGQGHTIKNIVCNTTSPFYLFYCGDGSKIRNIKFSGNHITTTDRLCIINIPNYNRIGTTISNIEWDNTNYLYGNYVSVVNGYMELTIDKIGVAGTIISENASTIINAGGAFGAVREPGGLIRNCYVTSNYQFVYGNQIYGFMYARNIFNSYTISTINCLNSAEIRPFFNSNCFYCYTANTVNANDAIIYGIGTGSAISSFYDSTLLPNAQDTANGQPTENLKSTGWLRSQGWAV